MTPDPWLVGEEAAGLRLDKWLADAARLGSRSRAVDALRRGRVFVDGVERSVEDAGMRLATGQEVRFWVDRPGSAVRRGARRVHGLDIVFEDDVLIVLDKPPGLATVPVPDRPDAPSLSDLVAAHWRSHGRREPLVVHRIDADTSGLVVVARTPRAYEDLKRQFEARAPLRRYAAFVHGIPTPPEGAWRDALAWDEGRRVQRTLPPGAPGAVEAVTHYRVAERFAGASLLEVTLETGRQHQVRVHAMLHRHPLLGERVYVGAIGRPTLAVHPRQALHAAALGFVHPVTHRPLELTSPLPEDLVALRRRLTGAPPATG